MKKLLLMLLGVLIAFPSVAADGDTFAYTYEGKALGYTVISEADKTVKTTGNYDLSGKLIIPETVSYNGEDYTVTEIGIGAFLNCTGLTSITIPNSVKTIGGDAFLKCSGLKKVEISDLAAWCGIDFANYEANPLYRAKHLYINGSEITKLVIPESVKKIKPYVFRDAFSFNSVVIPNSVTEIGEGAFRGCTGLKSVTIGNSVTTIGDGAFYDCSGLIKSAYPSTVSNPFGRGIIIQYPAEVAVIEDGFVWGPDKSAIYFAPLDLEGAFEIPNSVTEIGSKAFHSCSSLSDLRINDGDTEISFGSDALYNAPIKSMYIGRNWSYANNSAISTGLKSVQIGDKVTAIPDYAFNGCTGLTSVVIPDSVTSIGRNAFYGCSDLTSVVIPNSVKTIGTTAFENCFGLTSVVIGNSVTSIGQYAFYNCLALTKSAYPSTVSNPFSYGIAVQYPAEGAVIEDGFVWGPDKSAIHFAPYDLEGDFEISNSVTSIGNRAFEGCSGLTSVVIPDSVTSIGSYAFQNCSGLKKVEISDLAAWCGIDFGNYEANPLYKATHLYLNGSEITELVIPESVKKIKPYVFRDAFSFNSVVIPNSVTEIGEGAFCGCTGLTSVVIPDSVTSIGSNAFNGCSRLGAIELKSVTPPNFYSAFASYKDAATLVIPNGTYIDYIKSDWRNFLNIKEASGIQPDTFNDQVFDYRYMPNSGEAILVNSGNYSSMTSASIPDRIYVDKGDAQGFYNVTGIAPDAFTNCSKLTQLKISAKCTFIGDNAFNGCSGLTSVEIPNAVISIGDNAFYECSGLTSVTIGNSVTSIGDNAFYECSGLTSVEIPNSVISIGDNAFSGCTGLTSVTVGNSVTAIGDNAFYECSGLTNVTIGNSVTSIGSNAFSGCSSLTKVEISDVAAWCGIDFANNEANPLYRAKHLYINGSEITDLVIPSSVTEIKGLAFLNCSGLTSVTIGNSVTAIGSNTFSGCSGLKKVEISDLAAWCGIDFANYEANPLYKATHLYLNGSEITELVIPESVKKIKPYVFRDAFSFNSVVIPNSVAEIGVGAFRGCTGLKSVTIGNSVTAIGSSAFYDCYGLTSVEIPNSVTAIGSSAFYNCQRLKSFIFEDGVEPVQAEGAFTNYSLSDFYLGRMINAYFPTTTNLTVGGLVTSLPENFYKGNTTLESLTITNGLLQSIGASAFEDCSNLKEATFPENYVEIGENAFVSTGLTELTLPSGEIADNAFSGLNLTELVLGSEVAVIGENAFDGSNALKNVYSTPSTPPAAQNNTFSYYEGQLWVPEEAIDTYYNTAPCWYRFSAKALVIPEEMKVYGEPKLQGYTGEQIQLSAELSPADVTLDRILWHSSNPAIASVDNNGVVTLHNLDISEASDETLRALADTEKRTVEIIASTLYENGPKAVVTIDVETASIEYINSDSHFAGSAARPNDIYNLQGICLKRNASQSDIDALAPGLYIIAGEKVLVK